MANKRLESDWYVEGYATTFDEPYVLGEQDGVQYKELIDRNALVGADLSDVIMLYDHSGAVMARQSNGTLLVCPDQAGLFVAADLSKSMAARNLYEEIENKLITKMSWAFSVAEEAYDRATRTRRILKIRKVYDVSAVSLPANPCTDISARSWMDGVVDAERMETAANVRRARKIRLMMEV